MDKQNIAREKDRIRKQTERLNKKKEAQTLGIDINAVRNKQNAINNINKGLIVLPETIKKFNITFNDINKDHTTIHPDVIKTLTPKKIIIKLKPNPSKSTKIPLQLKPFNQTHIDEIIKNMEKNISSVTISGYKSKINKLCTLLKSDKNQLLKHLRNPNLIIDTLAQHYPDSYGLYIAPISSMAKHDNYFKNLIGIDNLKIYSDAQTLYSEYKLEERIRKADTTSTTPWDQILLINKNISKTQPYSKNHLISSLYTQLPPVRDNYGNIHIYQTPPTPTPNDHNYYIASTQQIIINNYKTGKSYGTITINIKEWSNTLNDIIQKSLQLQPRDTLITTNDNKIYYKERLEGEINKIFNGLSINTIRKSFRTHVHYNPHLYPPSVIIKINNIMGHSENTALTYVRAQTINP